MFFFFNDTATTEIYTLSLHDALPILQHRTGFIPTPLPHAASGQHLRAEQQADGGGEHHHGRRDRKSTRLNSSHANISYAVFCLKKKQNSSTSYLTHNTSV